MSLVEKDWVLAKGFCLSYHSTETMLVSVDPYHGPKIKVLNKNPEDSDDDEHCSDNGL